MLARSKFSDILKQNHSAKTPDAVLDDDIDFCSWIDQHREDVKSYFDNLGTKNLVAASLTAASSNPKILSDAICSLLEHLDERKRMEILSRFRHV